MIVPDRFGDNSSDAIPVHVRHTENRRMMVVGMYIVNCNNPTDVICVLSK